MEKKKKKLPFVIRFISWGFPKLEKVSSKAAQKVALNLFFTPARFPFPAPEKDMLAEAQLFSLSYKGNPLQGYKWGNSDKRILLAHGWASRGTQLYRFITPFLEEGYEVITFDQMAHGKSKGKRTNILDFSNVIRLVIDKFERFDAVIAHSMGGAATLLALKQKPRIKKLVCISAPTLSERLLEAFRQRLRASENTVSHVKNYVEKRYKAELSAFFAPAFQKELPQIIALIVHDEQDKEVSIDHAVTLHDLLPNSEFYRTQDLGHTRILKDDKVVEKIKTFILKK
ncbi:MAG: alpha/beta hydrolase [Cytophagales bacterium]|nr:alpha/beta hydrolase [Cytophagales bacterium]